jgi:hypothetical protein
MKKKSWIFLILLLFLALGSWWQFYPQKSDPHPAKQSTYCEKVPIFAFSPSQIPLIQLKIEEQEVPVKLDLGFQGSLSLPQSILQTLQQKKFISSSTHFGLKGKAYTTDIYSSPSFSLGKITFSGGHLREETPDFFQDSILTWDNGDPPEIQGRIGWQLFRAVNLLVDFQSPQIVVCDSLATLQVHQLLSNHSVRVTLNIDRGILEIDLVTAHGKLRCMLDTGCTWNILHTPNPENLSFPELLQDPSHEIVMDELFLADKKLNPQKFYRLPLQFPIPVEAILGVEFFKTHKVFIDFSNQQAYIEPILQLENKTAL